LFNVYYGHFSAGPSTSNTARIPHEHYPLLLLGYGDYLELADAVSFAVSRSRQAVLVFAPLFLIGTFHCCGAVLGIIPSLQGAG
jgi:hypothetical protein